ncbi:MAG: hypothetical protein WCQ57_05045, partial [Verrucomicrobiota bacterium]
CPVRNRQSPFGADVFEAQVEEIEERVDQRANEIELAFLPSCSLEHNPCEYLNCDFQSAAGKKPFPCTQSDLESNLKYHMRMLSKFPGRAASCFEAKAICYVAAA